MTSADTTPIPTPAAPLFEFDNSFAEELPELVESFTGAVVPDPAFVVFNEEIGRKITTDLARLEGERGAAILAGSTVPEDAKPVAMAYAGHQFGAYSPRLGDGRALLLGEVMDGDGHRLDIHLKGSGRTPFSRGGDGKATVSSMLREFLLAEAMHALGIPTGRALSVVSTGEAIMRQDGAEPGAVLARVASSHLRVGTFEYAARLEDTTVLRRLADYAIERHYQDAVASGDGKSRYLSFLEAVAEAQASLIAQWMSVGFIHGVMNTDNMTISGETIDYGPCAFMDRYDQSTVYSSIDSQGRYSFGNQPAIGQWNLARLAETLLSLIAEELEVDSDAAIAAVTQVLQGYGERLQHHYRSIMLNKLGLDQASAAPEGSYEVDDQNRELLSDLLAILEQHQVDYTSLFRTLSANLTDGSPLVPGDHPGSADLLDWSGRWTAAVTSGGRDPVEVAAQLNQVNPIYIPRNHLVDEVLQSAKQGDVGPFHQLLEVVCEPFVERDGHERFAQPAADGFDQNFRTYCGT